MGLQEEIEAVLESTIRPLVARHRGGIELVDVNEETGIVQVRFQGMCVGCPLSTLTLKAGVEAELRERFPLVREVVAITDTPDTIAAEEGPEKQITWQP